MVPDIHSGDEKRRIDAFRGTAGKSRRVVVVGGGISGLAAAHELAGVARVTVLEASPRLGGKLYGGELAGVSVDLGAESVLARRPEAVDLIRAVGLELTHPVTTSAGLWFGDRIRPLPPTVMGVPTDPAAVEDVLGDAAERVRHEPDLPPPALTGDVSIGRFVAARMGRAVTDRLVDPLLGGVYAGRADDLSLAAAVPDLFDKLRTAPSLLSAATELQSRAKSGTPMFAGVPGGVHRLVAALAADLERRGVELRTKCTVRRIARAATGFELATGPVPDTRIETADAVVVAAPASPACRMLADLAPAAASELAAIDYASLAIVTVAVPRDEWPRGAAGSGFLVPAVEGRIIKAATFSHQKWDWAGGDLAVFRASIGRLGEEQILQRTDDELVAAAILDLRAAIGLDAPVVASMVTRWGGGLPQYRVGHPARVDRIDAAVGQVPGLAVCGAAYRGVGIAACVASARRAATRVREHLDKLATMSG